MNKSPKGYAGLRTEECIDLPTIQVPDGSAYSLVSRELWERCATTFQSMLPAGALTISLSEVKRQWKDENPYRSTFEVSAAESRVGIVGSEVNLPQFALGSLLLSRTSNCPKLCSVQQYIDSGFTGSTMLVSCCEGKRFWFLVFVMLLIVNTIASVASMAVYWISPLCLLTLGIGTYLFYTWHRVFFIWKNEHLPGTTMVFSVYGIMPLTLGVFAGIVFEEWYKFWYWWCTLQLVYFCLSTVLLAHTCLLLKNLSLSTQIPVPQVAHCTTHMATAWGLLAVDTACLAAAIVSSACVSDMHVIAVAGTVVLTAFFVAPAAALFAGAGPKGYPRKLWLGGLAACALALVANAGVCVAFVFAPGSFTPGSNDNNDVSWHDFSLDS
ncbi:hypothetical protein Pelo_10358 [Pelomyxa schiedti]|nr:hypothetical protein Pelo_10358 [Pelomyxa schiedti]